MKTRYQKIINEKVDLENGLELISEWEDEGQLIFGGKLIGRYFYDDGTDSDIPAATVYCIYC